MKDYTSENIINLALVGHASSGKTCLSESMSLVSGSIHKIGNIQGGSTLSDYRKQEIDRQHSISMSLLNFEYLDKKINLIDAPGYLDFIGEMKSALYVVDNAGIVINASEGIEVGTELAWEFSEENNVSKYFIINMCNRDLSKFEEIVSKLKERFGRNIFPVMFPVNEGESFNQIADVLKREILEFDASGNISNKPADGDWEGKLSSCYNELIEMVAESDESLLEAFFDKGELSEDELRGGLKTAIKEGLIPVFCSAGEKNVGTKRIVEFMSKYGTSAADHDEIKAKKVGLCVAGSTNILAEKLNMTLPIETHCLQACVSEPVKPLLDGVVTFGAGHFYISQSDKGEMVMGGDLDGYNSYAQRGNLPTIQHVLTGGLALFPFLSRLKMLRTWGGIMDMSMDGSPIIDKTHIDGLYLNCGWCYGGFKSTPVSGWTFAHTIAQDRPHELNSELSLNRFSTGHLLDEKGIGTKTWIG